MTHTTILAEPIVKEISENNPSRETTRKINSHPKHLLDSKNNYKKGDFVTTNDDNEVVEAYVVEKVDGDCLTLCGIKLTEEKDDVVPYSFGVHKSEILYIGDAFVNMYGALWNIKQQILSTIG